MTTETTPAKPRDTSPRPISRNCSLAQIARMAVRFEGLCHVEPNTGCIIWRGSLNREGYGLFFAEGRRMPAHRFAYEHANGSIPTGLVLDHLCRTPACVNPAHLEPVTIAENVRRGIGPAPRNSAKTHCSKGHEFTPENTMPTRGGRNRACRECNRQNCRRIARARRLEVGGAA